MPCYEDRDGCNRRWGDIRLIDNQDHIIRMLESFLCDAFKYLSADQIASVGKGYKSRGPEYESGLEWYKYHLERDKLNLNRSPQEKQQILNETQKINDYLFTVPPKK